jgi:hypothetical protein
VWIAKKENWKIRMKKFGVHKFKHSCHLLDLMGRVVILLGCKPQGNFESLEKEKIDSLEKENFDIWKWKFWQFKKRNFDSLKNEILTVWKRKFCQFGKGKLWQFGLHPQEKLSTEKKLWMIFKRILP